jgi:hypothetical protein
MNKINNAVSLKIDSCSAGRFPAFTEPKGPLSSTKEKAINRME